MARSPTTEAEGSGRGRVARRGREAGARYVRYTQEQIDALERAYLQCSNPDHEQRAEIVRQESILHGIDLKQIKVWFQNRRCREKNKRENCDLSEENKRLTGANRVLREENDNLQRKLSQVIRENDFLRNQLITPWSGPSSGMVHLLETINPQVPMQMAGNNQRSAEESLNFLLPLAEETREEFMSKAIGNTINWIPSSGLKVHNMSLIGSLFVSSGGDGVAARACVTLPLDPTETTEILKDRPSWFRQCRSMNVNAIFPANNGGTIELVHTQFYAPTILACARDFWTLRYTSVLDDGGFVVCEKSISGCDAAPSPPTASEFFQGKMLASGYLVRPIEGGSSVHLVNHLNLEAASIPNVVQFFLESSEFMAKKMVVSALHFIERMIEELNGKRVCKNLDKPSLLKLFSNKICSGFDYAVNCFLEDGWVPINTNAPNDITMSIRQKRNIFDELDGVICVKASILLQNVQPANMVRVLKERRSSWMFFNFTNHSVAFSRAACYAFPGPNIHRFVESSWLCGFAECDNETLEIFRYERKKDHQSYIYPSSVFHLLLINNMEDASLGSYSEFIFSPMDSMDTNADNVMLSSGFRIFSLGSTMGGTSNEASSSQASVNQTTSSMMVLAFQFPLESHLREEVVALAQQYVQHVISSVRSLSSEVSQTGGPTPVPGSAEPNPGGLPEFFGPNPGEVPGFVGLTPGGVPGFAGPNLGGVPGFVEPNSSGVPGFVEPNPGGVPRYVEPNPRRPNPRREPTSGASAFIINLVEFTYQSYRSTFGTEMPGFDSKSTNSTFDTIQRHQHAIVYYSSSTPPLCLYANTSALNMLETIEDDLPPLTVDRMLEGSGFSLRHILPTITENGFTILPPGFCTSMKNRISVYARAVVWQVQNSRIGQLCGLAFAFEDWSFSV